MVGPIDTWADSADGRDALRFLAISGWPVVFYGRRQWSYEWTVAPPLVVRAPALSPPHRLALWRSALATDAPESSEIDGTAATHVFEPERVWQAVEIAQQRAIAAGRGVTADDVTIAARALTSERLGRFTRRIEPSVGWTDLVVSDRLQSQLERLAARARNRYTVLREWRLRPANRGHGVVALFAGPSGTGKTMSAEVLASDLGLSLCLVDLAMVVDKYIGETEKHLEQVFAEVEEADALLFFDEADALFGKRSEVRDARDRYANIEVAYLLQRIEAFDGIAILATNMSANLDNAFSRRLDEVVAFTVPNHVQRAQIWDRCLGKELARSDDVDLPWCATRFELAGGQIRSAATTAAYLAAQEGPPVRMHDIIAGVVLEYRKLGLLCTEADFGPWYDVVGQVAG